MGDVYRAHDRRTGRVVALKLLLFDDAALVKRMAMEARALIEINHPAVVRHVAHETEGGRAFIAMEWLEGITLSQRMRRTPLSVDEALAVVARIAEGLGAAHDRGMVHRDVKPSNVLLVGSDLRRPKLLDFGIVRRGGWDPVTATGVGMGTPEYMSPEQARCDRAVGPAADVFALGSILFKCLTGRPAFRGERIEAVLAKIAMFEEPPRVSALVPEIPRAVDELVARMMAYDPARRPRDGSRAAEAIRTVRAMFHGGAIGTSEVMAFPSLTTRELQPVSIIFAAMAPSPEDELAQTLAMEPIRVSVTGATTQAELRAPADDGSTEGALQVVRGPSQAARLLPALREALEPFGARIEVLLNGSFVAMLSGGAAATDLAARSARCALAIARVLPDASLGVATNRAVLSERDAVGRIIDRAAGLVEAGARRIAMDRATRDLLPMQFAFSQTTGGPFTLLAERARQPDAEEPPRPLLGRATPCVGRGRLLRQLEAAAAGTIDDATAHAIVLLGEAGVGKSRVHAELLRRLRQDQPTLTVFAAWGDALRAQVPYGMMARALRSHLGLAEGAGTSPAALTARISRSIAAPEDQRVAEFLGELMGIELPAAESIALRAARGDAALMADQKRRAWQDWLVAQCAAGPVLLVVDDLQWADAASVELISAGLRCAADLPLLVVALARPEARERFPTLASDWERQEILVEPLRPGASDELVREMLGDRIDARTRSRLVERSAGNPFYLEELIRAAAGGELEALPESVMASVQLRIARLPEPARHILRAASIFGRSFWLGGVAALVGNDLARGEIEGWLRTLDREELIATRALGSSYGAELELSFRHDLTREAAYGMLTDSDRATGHRLAGAWLQEQGETDAVVLAEHFAGGGAAEQAVSWFERAAQDALSTTRPDDDLLAALGKAALYYRRAGETAAKAHAYGTAVVFLERAAALFASLHPIDAARSRLLLARSREPIGERNLALDDLTRAQEELGADGLRSRLGVEILLEAAALRRRTEAEAALDAARALAQRARKLAREVSAEDLEAQACTALAGIYLEFETVGARKKALEYALRAITLSRDSAGVGWSVWRLANVFLMQNHLEQAEALYADALATAERTADELLRANCLMNIGMSLFRRWKIAEAIEKTLEAREIYQRVGHHSRLVAATLNVGTFFHVLGDFASARPLLDEVLDRARTDWVTVTLCQEALADLERSEGNEEAAQRLLTAAAELCARVNAAQKEALYRGLVAESKWASGAYQEAFSALERAVEVGEGVTLSHALIQMKMGHYAEAAAWLEYFRHREADPDRRLLATLALARVRWSTGQPEEASAIADQACHDLRPMGVPRFLDQAQVLADVIAGRLESAVELLSEPDRWTRPGYTDALLDLANGFAVHSDSAPDWLIVKFLQLSPGASDGSSRCRIEDIRSRLFHKLGQQTSSRASLAVAQEEAAAWIAAVPSEYREGLADHPWVRSVQAYRLIPY